MRKQKTTLLPEMNPDRKKIKLEAEKVNKVLQYIPMDDMIELNELIYTRTKLVGNKIGILQKNPNRKRKPGREIRLEGQIKKLWQ